MTVAPKPGEAPVAVIVNDDPIQLTVLEDLATHAGLIVQTFSGAEVALATMNPDHPPALIVTDLYMPGIDGWQFCRLLRSHAYAPYNPVPIIIVSATFAGVDAIQTAADLDVESFMASPVDGEVFIAKIRELLSGENTCAKPGLLVVEDEHPIAEVLARAFSADGYQVDIAPTVAGAIQAFTTNDYRLAVIDYHLPDGAGDSLLEMFHNHNPDCALIMMTGDANPALAREWMKRGAASYVSKPFETAYLVELCMRARRERSLLRMPALIENRTKALQESELRYRYLFEFSRDGIVITDFNGRIIDANKAFCRMVNYSSKELQQLSSIDLLTPENLRQWERKEIWENQVLREGSSKIYERPFIRKGGHTFPAEIQAYAVLAGDRSIKFYGTVVRDITQRKLLEEHVRQAQKMDSIGRLAGGIAHDFNNIIGVVLGHAQLGLCEVDANHPAAESLQEIEGAANRASQITRQLLTFASREPISPQSLDVNDSIVRMLSMLRRLIGENIQLEWVRNPELWMINMDPSQLDQILINLCVNARDAMDASGRIVMQAENRRENDSLCSRYMDARPGDYVRIAFTDNGSGMTQETLERLFEPFYSTKKKAGKGTGLGLATVYGIVRQNGGFIDVESTMGEGSTFYIFLPRHDAAPKTSESKNAETSLASSGHTILLVEDDAAFLNLLNKTLGIMGYTVLTANSAAKALEIADTRIDDVDLVLTDVVMPGINGVELAKRLVNMKPGLRVVYMSGYASAEIGACGLEIEESSHFIQKPFSRHDLYTALAKALDT